MGLIRINYTQAIRESNRLKEIKSNCTSINTLIDRLINQVPTYWQGDAAQAFIEELQQLKHENNSIGREAYEIGTTVRRVADQIREAERRAIAAMKND